MDKMNNAPVYFTVCQVRFNAILSLVQYVAEIQERMRKAGFPDFWKREENTINFEGVVGGQPVAPKIEKVEQFLFSNMKRTLSFMLSHDGLSFQVSEYDTFISFRDQYMSGLRVVHEVVGLNFIERVGIRYLDLVDPKPEEKLTQYLAEHLHGMSSYFDRTEHRHTYSETVAIVKNAAITSRVVIKRGKVGIATDLGPPTVVLPTRVTNVSGPHAIIDTDGAINVREEFSLSAIERRLESLHEEITKVFIASATPHALKVWQ